MHDAKNIRMAVGGGLLVALGLSLEARAGEPGEDKGKTQVRPEITVSGATTGEVDASVGAAFWQPIKTVPFDDLEARPVWMTYVVDGSVAVDAGRAQFVSVSSTGSNKLTVPSRWSAGFSIGAVFGYNSNELFNGWLRPDTATVARFERPIAICERTCALNSKAAGCKEYIDYRANTIAEAKDRWLLDTIIQDDTEPTQIVKRMTARVPVDSQACMEAKSDWTRLSQKFVSQTGSRRAVARQELEKSYESALGKCRESCKDSDSEACKTLKVSSDEFEDLSKPSFTKYPPNFQNELCAAGRDDYIERELERPLVHRLAAARYPRVMFSVGGEIGFVPHKFLAIDADAIQPLDENGVPIGDPLDGLTDRSKAWMVGQTGISIAGVTLDGVTLEARGLYGRAAKAQSTKSEWCTSSGIVGTQPGDPPAESCTTRPLGAPKVTDSVTLDLRVGYADRNGVYRLAFGPRYAMESPVGGDVTHKLGFYAPLYLNLLAAPRRNEKLDYDGLIQFTPFVDVTLSPTSSGGVPVVAGISFALLGRRALFSTKYDEL